MRSVLKFVVVGLVVFQGLAFSIASVRAETLTWIVRSEHSKVVNLEFYSLDRAVSWPGGGEIFTIDDDQEHSYRLSCEPGEKICYGAWLRDRKRSYWGAGFNARNRCKTCCYTCDGMETRVIALER